MQSLFSFTRKIAIFLFAASLAFSMVPAAAMAKDAASEKTDAPDAALLDTFEGDHSDYDFEEAKTILFNMEYKYSNTGGLAGIDALSPATVKALVVPQDDGTYECEISLQSKEDEGFRMTLDATPLNNYLVNPPKGNETQEELHAMLQNGDFAGDVKNECIYRYQEVGGLDATPDYEATNPTYKNRYSTEYNEAWNAARTLVVDGDDGFSAAIVSRDTDAHVGANALPDPKLVVKFTEAQMKSAAANGRDITVNYRRNATWYTVKHWVPTNLSGLTDEEINDKPDEQKKTKDDVNYVLLDSNDSELIQGRVGALTRAAAKTDGAYETLVSESFQQKLIEASGTVVDIYYKAADFYRVIFDTDYAYIPRQHVELNGSVDLPVDEMAPTKKGYSFAGWQYLKKDAVKSADGSYPDGAYALIGDASTMSLILDSEFISQKAKIVTTEGVKTLSLRPKWVPDTTKVTVILWTENLTGYDVQAKAKGGDGSYYDAKYTDYKNEIAPIKPSLGGGNAETYSNVGSFTVNDIQTDSSLLGSSATKLKDEIQARVNSEFAAAVKDSKGDSASEYYTQCSFEIMHATDGVMDKSPTTANADGETAIYVYFTRNIYTLQFNYYGTAGSTRICNNTNGFSYAPDEDIAKFRKDGLDFSYDKSNQKGSTTAHESNRYVNVTGDMTVPQTITIRAKYGADLRDVWPSARPEENLETKEGSMHAVSWATTAGDYNAAARGSENPEPTIMGLYATMDEGIIADPVNTENVHQLAMYWYYSDQLSYYRYNHCFELPKFNVSGVANVKEITLYKDPDKPDALQNKLYLVPTSTPGIAKYDFSDLLKVSYNEKTKTVNYDDPHGAYYAVRGYVKNDGTTKYYAVGRRVTAPSSNDIMAQKPSARAHMQRVNKDDIADHTTQYADEAGRTWGGGTPIGFITTTKTISPYDIYFYYDRNKYTITYMSSSQREDVVTGDVELGHIELPFGAHVTDDYAFKLDMHDTNQATIGTDTHKYLWIYPTDDKGNVKPAVPVCPDRAPKGNAPWVFTGWGLGPAGVNMQWTMPEENASMPQAQETNDFYISSDLLLYAIWKVPMLTVTFHLNGGVLIDRTADTLVAESIPANTKITETSTAIPRPVRDGHEFFGWYTDSNPTVFNAPFDFDQPIIEDTDVFAIWKPITNERFDYTVYHVAPTLAADDTTPHETIQLDDDGNIVPSGGTNYYVLTKDIKTDQVYTKGMIMNLTASLHDGYVPRRTNNVLEPTLEGPNNVVFVYDAHVPGSFVMNFIEAGTEKTTSPTLVKTVKVEADQAIMTPDKATAEELVATGYKLVNRNDDESYEPVSNSHDLTWIDEYGKVCSIKDMNDRVIANNAPHVVVYLVQPIPYAITYENAEGSSLEADTALAGVTPDEGTPVEAALAVGKNPTQYTVKDRFTVKNPGRVQTADGKWYAFSHWTLGDGTTTRTPASADDANNDDDPVVSASLRATGEAAEATYATLRINPGTIGSLKFIANWIEVPENDPVVAPNDPEDPNDPADPIRPPEPTIPDNPSIRALGLAQAGDDADFVSCLTLATLSGLFVIALSIRRFRES